MLLIIFLMGAFFCSCSYNPLVEHPVEVLIPSHPWETSEPDMWMLLATSLGEKIHLPAGERKAVINVPYGKTVYVAVSPLGEYAPFGTFLTAAMDKAELDQERGHLARYLVDNSPSFAEVISLTDGAYLFSMLSERGVSVFDLDRVTLLRDILNNRLGDGSFVALPRHSVAVADIPTGRWVAEREDDGNFWYDGEHPVLLSFSDGLHCYLCRERSLLLKIHVDAKESLSFTSVHGRPRW
jgi:hypothetical protein